MNCYAMESLAYLTSGMLDQYQEPDLSVESAIVKVGLSVWLSFNLLWTVNQ